VPRQRYSLDSLNSITNPSNLRFLKSLFRFIFVISHITALYSLYFLDNLSLFLISLSFGITIGLFYFFTFIIKSHQATLHPRSRTQRHSKSEFVVTIASIFSFIIIGTIAYYLYHQNILVLNPYSRIKLSQITPSWDYSTTPPIFTLSGQIINNNPYTLPKIVLNGRIFPKTDYQNSLSVNSLTVSDIGHNSAIPFVISFPDLIPQDNLGYSVTFSL